MELGGQVSDRRWQLIGVIFTLIGTAATFALAYGFPRNYYQIWAHGAALTALLYGLAFQVFLILRLGNRSRSAVAVTILYVFFVLGSTICLGFLWSDALAQSGVVYNCLEYYDRALFLVVAILFLVGDSILWTTSDVKDAAWKY